MKKVIVLVLFSLCIPVIAFPQATPPGRPFETIQQEISFLQAQDANLQNQINNIQLTPGPLGRAWYSDFGLSPGAYQIVVKTDPYNVGEEFSEKNNIFVNNFNVPIIIAEAQTSKSVKVKPPSNDQGDWRLSKQNAIKIVREFQKYNCCKGLATKIEAELKSSEKTMIAAEQLLSKKPINRQAGKSIVDDISKQIKNLENSMEEVRNKRQEYMTAFENFDQKANQLFNILSTVLKNQKEMQEAITRNML
jgi:hypothetical protein